VYAFDASSAAAQTLGSGSDDEFVSIDHAMVEHANQDGSDGASLPVINLDLDLEVDASAGHADENSGAAVDLDLGGDWGLSASGGDAADSQTGDDAAAAPAISWDIDCVEIEAGSGAEGAPPAISWDLDDAGADAGSDNAIGGGFSSSSSSSSSKAKAAQRIGGSLLEADTRHAFTSDLLELEAFFQTRMTELTAAAADGMHMPPLPGAPAVLTRESADSCRAALACVADLLAAVRDPALVQLIMIRSSPKYGACAGVVYRRFNTPHFLDSDKFHSLDLYSLNPCID
jgi:hypothetical protein